MASFVRIIVLIWVDILVAYAMWVMMTYLTNVWKLSFTYAAGIINIWGGLAYIMPIGFSFLVDTLMGNYSRLLLSSIAYSIGLGFLSMSTPPLLSNSTGTCSEYHPECIGHTQKALFYTALALIAVGISGHLVSLVPFFVEQITSQTSNDQIDMGRKVPFQIAGSFAVILTSIMGGIALPYIKPWSIRFGIPAICTLVATLLFTSGSCSYKYTRPQGSPLTTLFRVFVASTSKMFERLPNDAEQLYEKGDSDLHSVPHTPALRCLDKAAIILPTTTKGEQERNKWGLCRVTEVEQTKIAIRMVPMWMTFIVCGVVTSIGNMYFIEQANHMNRKVGKLKVPLPILLVLFDLAKSQFVNFYTSLANCLGRSGLKRYPAIGMSVAMIFAILCCITAAKVESRRLNVIRTHGLLDKPDERIPMSVFWLLPQFLLLAGLDRFSENSIFCFFSDQAPPSMRNYMMFFTHGVLGLGIMCSVLSVYIVGEVSERKGRTSWFQYTLNKSRLDNYYWTLAALSAVNLVLYILVAILYPYRESTSEEEEAPEIEESAEDNGHCCCCG